MVKVPECAAILRVLWASQAKSIGGCTHERIWETDPGSGVPKQFLARPFLFHDTSIQPSAPMRTCIHALWTFRSNAPFDRRRAPGELHVDMQRSCQVRRKRLGVRGESANETVAGNGKRMVHLPSRPSMRIPAGVAEQSSENDACVRAVREPRPKER
jgi:hypothetical protein